jgi:hypothetical protein
MSISVTTGRSNTTWFNSLAYFLIDNDIDIVKGQGNIDKALKMSPDNTLTWILKAGDYINRGDTKRLMIFCKKKGCCITKMRTGELVSDYLALRWAPAFISFKNLDRIISLINACFTGVSRRNPPTNPLRSL